MALEDVLGVNARNFSYIRACNPREVIRLVDNKLKTKRVLKNAGLPVPETYKVFRRPEQVRKFDFKSLPNSFVVKPNSGFGGKGILVVFGRTKRGFLRSDGGDITEEQLKLHILNILEGTYSLSGLPDVAYIEERIKPDRTLKRLAYRGLPDIRVIVFRLVPIMAMLRLPTVESRGRANLHEGAIGVGIDLGSGVTLDGFRNGKRYKVLPRSKTKLRGKKIKFWEEILLLASEAQAAAGGDFLGVDIALTERGPLILELNARPGLSIQNVNKAGLRERLERLKKIGIERPEKGVKLGKELFRVYRGYLGEEERPVIGLVEVVEFFGKKHRIKTLAKIDTGAYSCSLDFSIAKQMGLEELVDKSRELHRAFREKDKVKIEKLQREIKKFPEVIRFKKVRSSLGKEVRPLIKVKLRIAGKLIKAKAHLSNRRHLKYPVILGRLTARDFIVDPLKYTSRLRPFAVKSLDEVRAFFALYPRRIIGLSVNAVRRAGPEKFLNKYLVAALRKNTEDLLLGKEGLNIFSVAANTSKKSKIEKMQWNSKTVVASKEFKSFLESLHSPTAWMVYAPSEKIKKVATEFGAKVLAVSPQLFERLDNKVFLRKVASKLNLPAPSSKLLSSPADWNRKKGKLTFPVVVQELSGMGGRGSRMVKNKEELVKILAKEEKWPLLVSEKKEGVPLSIEGCVLKKDVFYLPPQIQVVDQEELVGKNTFGRFCGHDFNSSLIPEEIQKICFEYVEKIGEVLRREGFKGLFSLDCIWAPDGKVYLIELNPRLTGTLPVQLWIQLAHKQIPLLAWHLMGFLKASYSVNQKRIQTQYLRPRRGAHLVLHYLGRKPAYVTKGLKAGVYFFNGRKLIYRRADHNFSKLNKDEIIITDGVPAKGTYLKPGFTLCRIITKNSVLDKSLKCLNPWARQLVKILRAKVEL